MRHRIGRLLLLATLSLTTRALFAQSDATNPRKVLDLFGFDASTMRQFLDGQPLDIGEYELVYRLLHLLPRLEPLDVHRWRRPMEHVNSIAAQSDTARGEIYQLTGWVTSIEQIGLSEDAARRFGYANLFRVRMTSSSDNQAYLILARGVPEVWQEQLIGVESLQLPASCDAMFLKLGQTQKSGEGASPSQEYVFATTHIAWHPFEPNTRLGINTGKALLGRGRMDVAQFDSLEQERPIGYADRECFYQMLWTVARLDPRAMREQSRSEFDIAQLLKQPTTQAGQFYNLRGLARRAVRILVDSADVQAKYGIDHYYEVDVFLPLPRTLKLVDPRDGHSREYSTFPVTFCVRRLPDEMPVGPSIRQEVQICGSYMKLWSYRSEFVSESSSSTNPTPRRQRSPLFIADTVTVVQQSFEPNRWPEFALVAGFLTALVIIGLAAWSYAKGDQAFVARRRQRPNQLPQDLP